MKPSQEANAESLMTSFYVYTISDTPISPGADLEPNRMMSREGTGL